MILFIIGKKKRDYAIMFDNGQVVLHNNSKKIPVCFLSLILYRMSQKTYCATIKLSVFYLVALPFSFKGTARRFLHRGGWGNPEKRDCIIYNIISTYSVKASGFSTSSLQQSVVSLFVWRKQQFINRSLDGGQSR